MTQSFITQPEEYHYRHLWTTSGPMRKRLAALQREFGNKPPRE